MRARLRRTRCRWFICTLLIAVQGPGDARTDSGIEEALAARLAREPAPAVRSDASPAVAAALLDALPPEELERRIADRPALVPGLFGTLGEALTRGDPELAARIGPYLNEVTRAHSRRLSAAPDGFRPEDIDFLLTLQLVDLGRFVADPVFRTRILDLLPGALDPGVAPASRDRLIYRLCQVRGVGFEAFEAVAGAWGALARDSRGRELSRGAELSLGDSEERIRASVYSLSSEFFEPPESLSFLDAVRRAAPGRELIVLADRPLLGALATRAEDLGLRLVDTWGFPVSPWLRDPLTFLHAEDGKRVVLLRPPNERQGRPEDSWLGRVLVQGLPDDLDADWKLHWRQSGIPFHNGQILMTADRLWITVHTLEFRILEILGLARVPVGRFGGPEGVRYVEAALKAAEELGELYGRPVSLVHPLPAAGDDPETRRAALLRLGGGAGFDLDSLVTLLPASDGAFAALVADPGAAVGLLEAVSQVELDRFAEAYGLGPRGPELRRRLIEGQTGPRARRLAAFLDLVARHLESWASVRRLPLALVSRTLQRDRGGAGGPEFLVGWNNVVIERANNGDRAEGFASLLARGDEVAAEAFGSFGYHLDLFPPLVESVLRNGGYRCASQHVR